MFNQFLDRDKREVFDTLKAQGVCRVGSTDKKALSDLIGLLIVHHILNHQYVSISLCDDELLDLVKIKLKKFGLDAFTLDIRKEGPSPSQIAKWNVLAKKLDKSSPRLMKKQELTLLLSKMTSFLEDRNKKIFGSKSWRQINEIKDSRVPRDIEQIYLPSRNLGFEFNQNEYWHLKSVIEEAATLWNPLFEQIQAQNLFQKGAELRSPHKVKLLRKWKKDLNQVQEIVHNYLSRLTSTIYNQYIEHFEDAESIIASFPERINFLSNQKNSRSSSFFYKKNKTNTAQKDYFSKIASNPIFEDVDFTLPIDEIYDALKHSMSNWKRYVEANTTTRLKRLTRLNIDDDEYKKAIQIVESLFDEINKEQLINYHFEFTAHSLDAQMQYFDEVENILNRILWVLESAKPYLEWHHFTKGLDQGEHALVSALIKKEDNYWLEFFEQWYVCALVEAHKSPHFNISKETVDNILEIGSDYIVEIINNWINKTNEKIHLSLANLKKANRSFYNSLLGKGSKDYTFFPEDIRSFCPIIIGGSTHTDLSISDGQTSATTKQKVLQITSQEYEKNTFYLSPSTELEDALNSYPLSQRLGIIKSLANKLRSYSKQNRIFILKSKTIISCLSDLANRKYLDLRKEDIIKEIQLGSDPVERITEYLLLNDLPCQIWIDSFLINENDPSTIIPQLSLIKSFTTAGYIIQSKFDLDKENELLFSMNPTPVKRVKVDHEVEVGSI